MGSKKSAKRLPLKQRIRIAVRRHLWRPLRNTVGLATGRYIKAPNSRYPASVGNQNPAGFFVNQDECVNCAVCGPEAPGFIEFAGYYSNAHVVKQPETDEEMELIRGALEVCCVDAFYYGGDDPRALAIVDAVAPKNGRPQFTFLGSLTRRVLGKSSQRR